MDYPRPRYVDIMVFTFCPAWLFPRMQDAEGSFILSSRVDLKNTDKESLVTSSNPHPH